MICRVHKCQGIAIVDLCGKHEEDREDGIPLTMNVGRPKQTAHLRPVHAPSLRPPRCAARTKKGTERCLNEVVQGFEFCGVHLAIHRRHHA